MKVCEGVQGMNIWTRNGILAVPSGALEAQSSDQAVPPAWKNVQCVCVCVCRFLLQLQNIAESSRLLQSNAGVIPSSSIGLT